MKCFASYLVQYEEIIARISDKLFCFLTRSRILCKYQGPSQWLIAILTQVIQMGEVGGKYFHTMGREKVKVFVKFQA